MTQLNLIVYLQLLSYFIFLISITLPFIFNIKKSISNKFKYVWCGFVIYHLLRAFISSLEGYRLIFIFDLLMAFFFIYMFNLEKEHKDEIQQPTH